MNRKIFTIILIVALAALLIFASIWYNKLKSDYDQPVTAPADESATSEIAPDFTVYDGEGNTVNLSDKFGTPIVINFWASWCGPCKHELPDFQDMYDKYGDEVLFMMVNMTNGRETEDGVKEFIAGEGYTFPVYYDKDMSAAITYNLRSIPRSIFLNSDGSVSNAYMGVIDAEALEANIELILSK